MSLWTFHYEQPLSHYTHILMYYYYVYMMYYVLCKNIVMNAALKFNL